MKSLVELHGGTVQATSPGKGQGATFLLSLPLLVVHGGNQEPLLTPAPSAAEAPVQLTDLSGFHVLVIDNEADARVLVRRILMKCGAVVTTASGAAEGSTPSSQVAPK